MISIQGKPDKFSLLGEKQVFTFLSDNFLASPGTKAELILQFLALYDGSFTIAYGSKLLTFQVRETMLNDGLEIPAYDPGDPLFAWVYSVAAYFNRNVDLYNDFLITSTDNLITFQARENGSRYSLSITLAESIDPGDITVQSNSAGTDRSIRENFAISIQPLVQDGPNSNYEVAAIRSLFLELNVDDYGRVYFCPNDIVEPYIKSTFRKQFYASIPVRKNNDILRRYALRYSELYGNPAVYHAALSTEILFLINGRIPQWQQHLFTDVTFLEWLSSGLRFLTFTPVTRKVLPDEFIKLFFIYRTEYTIPADYRILLRIRLTFDDATFVNIDQGTGADLLHTGEVLEVDCGYDQLGLSATMTNYPDKTLHSYSVWLVGKASNGSETTLSEVKTFEVDYDFYEFRRQFIFRNSIGGFDTIYCLGKSSFENEYTRETADFEQSLNPYELAISRRDYNIEQNLLGNHTTGYFDKRFFAWIQDFFASDQVYEITGEGFKPCRITSSNINLDDENEMMLTIDFQTEYLTEYGQFAVENVQGEFTNEFNEEFV